MWVFGCAWKINFPENIFNWPCFNGFDPEIGFSQNFHFKPFPDSRTKRERESPDHAFDFVGEPRAQITPLISPIYESIYEPTDRSSTQSLRPMSLQIRWRPRAFAPQTHELISLSLSLSLCHFDFLCDFDRPTNRSMFLCDFDFLLSLWSLIFLLLLWWCGWWCFGGFPIVWWWVLCGWWWKIAFSECYQTHENIF